MLTSNHVLVDNIRPTKTIFCIQRNAEKVIITEDILVASNVSSFGDDIGKTTNKVTAMYDVQSLYEPGSEEYEILEYRIQSGQLFQQNAIDRIKGIVCNPMPRSWYDYHANALPEGATEEDTAKREFNLRILADKKPYFMIYIYPTLMKQYKTYIKNVETKCAREFRVSLAELLAVPEQERTEEQASFITYYKKRLPVGQNDCVMNRICRRFEEEFDGKMKTWCEEPFDYSIMKSDSEYTQRQYAQIKKIYDEHNQWLRDFSTRRKAERLENDGAGDNRLWQAWFKSKCLEICSNGYALCDIVLDMCYKTEGSKEFVWDVAPHYVIANLAARHDGVLVYPSRDPDGELEYGGMRFTMREAKWIWKETEEELIERNSTEREGMGEEGD